jgi:membrane associated rhomboid family serine protease
VVEAIQTCYRHPDRRAGVTCQRCDRPICPSCMVSASVGFHCPECAHAGRQKVLTARNLRTRPIVTELLIAINVGVLVLGLIVDGSVVISGGRGSVFVNWALYGPIIELNNEWWRIITSGFLHIGIFHLAVNMWALWILGSQLERGLGRLRFITVYMVSLLCGSLGALLASPHVPSAGASGAIFGLLGCALAYQVAQRINIWASGLGGILVINLLITFGIHGISWGAHLGGLAGGYIVGWIYYEVGPRVKNQLVPLFIAWGIGLATIPLCLWAASLSVH